MGLRGLGVTESALEMRQATATMIAKELGVTANQVGVWHSRRAKNGFPETLGRAPAGEGKSFRTEARVWDLDAVLAWYKNYVPAVGGRGRRAAR